MFSVNASVSLIERIIPSGFNTPSVNVSVSDSILVNSLDTNVTSGIDSVSFMDLNIPTRFVILSGNAIFSFNILVRVLTVPSNS